MRQKYVNLVKDFISKKPEYKETLDEIKRDTEIVGATNEEFQEAIKEIETSENTEVKSFKKYKTKNFKIALSVILFVIFSEKNILIISIN